MSMRLSNKEAFFGIIYSAMCSIGEVVDEDYSRFNVAINRMNLFNGFTTDIANEYFEKIKPLIDTDWEGFVNEAATILTGELRETTFVISCDLVLRNGFVPPQAKGYLEMVQKALGIDDELFTKATEIIKIKNRG